MTTSAPPRHSGAAPDRPPPKVVVWDLDDTLWRGTLAEGDGVELRPGVRDVLAALDARGVLQSIASRNDPAAAASQLRALGIGEFFLCPQIGWGAKSAAIERIAAALGAAPDTMVFVDDERVERDEVSAALPTVWCVDGIAAADLVDTLGLRHVSITDESAARRALYRADEGRRAAEASFAGPSHAFLATLDMVVTIAPASEDDLGRAEELTLRTNQLNSTGRTYSRDELAALRRRPDHRLLIASLEDKYGASGRVGLALVADEGDVHVIKLLLVSCRVIARGIGGIILQQLMRDAKTAGARLVAHFVPTDRNRLMFVTYRLAGFRDAGRDGPVRILQHDLARLPPAVPYARVTVRPEG